MRIKRRKTHYTKPLQINQRPKYSNSVSNFVNKQHFKRMFRRAGATLLKKDYPLLVSYKWYNSKTQQDITTFLKQRMFHIIWTGAYRANRKARFVVDRWLKEATTRIKHQSSKHKLFLNRKNKRALPNTYNTLNFFLRRFRFYDFYYKKRLRSLFKFFARKQYYIEKFYARRELYEASKLLRLREKFKLRTTTKQKRVTQQLTRPPEEIEPILKRLIFVTIRRTENNMFLTAYYKKRVIATFSSGKVGQKGPRKISKYAAELMAKRMGRILKRISKVKGSNKKKWNHKLLEEENWKFLLHLKAPQRDFMVKTAWLVLQRYNLHWVGIYNSVFVAHNGSRVRKKRRT